MPEGGLVAGWAGQSGVLVPWGCDCGCSPRVSWTPTLYPPLVTWALMLHYKIGFPHFKENYFVLYGCFLFVPTDPIAHFG